MAYWLWHISYGIFTGRALTNVALRRPASTTLESTLGRDDQQVWTCNTPFIIFCGLTMPATVHTATLGQDVRLIADGVHAVVD